MTRSIEIAMWGCSSSSSSNCHLERANVVSPSGPATMSAERGSPSISDSSPK